MWGNVPEKQKGSIALDYNIYHVFHQAAGGVLHVRESLQDCASRAWDAEGEEGHSLPKVPPRAGRARGLHAIEKISMYDKNEPSLFQVKHAKAHAQMLRQTISAIKTEVWDWRMAHATPQMSWNANSDSSKSLFVNCLDCLQSESWRFQRILWTYLYLWAFSTVIRKVMIWATKCESM